MLLNSDTIERQITLSGQNITAGVTDTINLLKSTSNIDMGLVEKAKFDLKLDKSVVKISVQNKEGIQVHEYNNVTLAQLPITGGELKNSTIAVEYSIKITNEGGVAGYAKSVVDYMPKELMFNSELNLDWYIGNDGNLYTAALENEIINPGETKELRLILTKRLTENSTGIVNNNAEIKESYNERGLKDKDSVAGNKSQGEDDQGAADVLITIKTGGPVVIYSLSIIILCGIAVGIVYLQKNRKVTYK